MSLRVLDLSSDSERGLWLAHWQDSANREVFAHPGYLGLFSSASVRTLGALYSEGGGHVMFPFLLRDIKSEAFAPAWADKCTDITSPYGYGGPCSPSPGGVSASAFWKEFDEWAWDHGVVSEFIRFTLFSDETLPYPGQVEEKQLNVVRSLALGDEALWLDFEHKVRKNVIRARRENVQVEIDLEGHRLECFQRVYSGTMERRQAGGSYRFSAAFFRALVEGLKGQFAFFHALVGGKVVSTELVLVSRKRAYSFLGGTDKAFYAVRPNDLLKFEIIQWAKRSGLESYVLGGGYEPEDGIFRYKRSFAPDGCTPFRVGFRIHRTSEYGRLNTARAEWNLQHGRPPADERFFPRYRS